MGASIIGFGRYALAYADGSTADWPIAGFSPRKRDLTPYLVGVFDRQPELMKQRGPHQAAVGRGHEVLGP